MLAPPRNIVLRAFFVATGRYPTTWSRTVVVDVRDRVSVGGGWAKGCAVKLSGRTVPVKANRTIFIQNRGPSGRFTGWKTLWAARTNKNGAYSVSHTLACGSTYNLSTFIGHDASNLAGRSRTLYGIKTRKG